MEVKAHARSQHLNAFIFARDAVSRLVPDAEESVGGISGYSEGAAKYRMYRLCAGMYACDRLRLRWRGVISCVLAMFAALCIPQWSLAATTEAEAQQACIEKAIWSYNTSVADHGRFGDYVNGWRCRHQSFTATSGAYYPEVEIDVYHNGNYAWYSFGQYGYSTSIYDPLKACGGEPPFCPSGGTNTANPIHLPTGAKYKTEIDIVSQANDVIEFKRYYLGDSAVRPGSAFGGRWRGEYDREIKALEGFVPEVIQAFRPNGQGLYFKADGSGGYATDSDVQYRLTKLYNGSAHVGWTLLDTLDRVETYDSQGLLSRIDWPDGRFLLTVRDGSGLLVAVSSREGRALSFAYDSGGRLSAVTDPAGASILYGYDPASGLLSTVTYPGGSARRYFYNETANLVSPPSNTYYLTGVEDENAERHASYYYDGSNRAITSTKANNADRVDIVYSGGQSASIVDALGATTSRNWSVSQRAAKFTYASGLSVDSGRTDRTVSYDANGYPNIVTDFRFNQTDHDYSASGLEAQRIEAANNTTGSKRTIQTDWHATFRSPVERRTLDSTGSLKAKTNWTYNARNQVLTTTVTDPASSATRTTTTTYCEAADVNAGTCPFVGLVKSIDGARTDVADTMAYTYRQVDDTACATAPTTCAYRMGDLWKVTNAAGQVVETLAYDGAGRPLAVLDANGVRTDYEYHARGWLTARKVRGTNNAVETDDQITSIEYWPTGLVKKVTQPDGAFTSYAYDAAHRLTGIADNAGNSITYTLNAAGERTQEDTRDPGNTLTRTLSRAYNTLGQLQTVTDAYSRNTGFTYDANGNLDLTNDALSRRTDNDYDPLNRLSRTLQDSLGINAQTTFAYDALDNLVQVNDPKGLNTTYTYNGFSDLTQLASPDTGTTTYTYDSAGNRASQTDARGVTTTYGYDALNRLVSVGYPTSSLNASYVYDTAQTECAAGETFGVGRLTRMTDGSGNTAYCYDRFGQLVRRVQTVDGRVLTLHWAYLANGRLQKMTYPDNAEVDYLYDAQGRVTEIGYTPSGGARQVVLTGATYYAFGPVSRWTYGNGRVMERGHNLNYQPGFVEVQAPGGIDLGYEFDQVGNLKRLRTADQAEPPLRQYGYDGLNRLTQSQNGSTSAVVESYTYDKTGNRTTKTVGGSSTAYTYPGTSHRLTDVGGVARGFDANGNTTAIGGTAKEFVYGDHNRMTQVKAGGVTTMNYVYNGRGERVHKWIGGNVFYSLYDEAGRWVGDYQKLTAGVTIPLQQVIWLGDLPVGLIVGDGTSQVLRYIEPDALGTPRVVVDPARGAQGTAVWTWPLTGEAFGDTAPNQDPDGDSTAFVFDMRFPGQRYDSATGLNYNYFRDYDANAGRYSQSDPIGIVGGISTYGYVGANPSIYSDSRGLARHGGKTGQWWEFTDRNFQRWYHQCVKMDGDPDADREQLAEAYAEWIQYGKPDGMNGCGGPPPPPVPTKANNCPPEDDDGKFWGIGPSDMETSPVTTVVIGIGLVLLFIGSAITGIGS